MKAKNEKNNKSDRLSGLNYQKKGNSEKNNFTGYPAYPPEEDIYSKYKEEQDINPEDISRAKDSNYLIGKKDDEESNDTLSGSNLDVPGSELDDNQENVGSEDEENNYYSIGGDDHNDLEEDQADSGV